MSFKRYFCAHDCSCIKIVDQSLINDKLFLSNIILLKLLKRFIVLYEPKYGYNTHSPFLSFSFPFSVISSTSSFCAIRTSISTVILKKLLRANRLAAFDTQETLFVIWFIVKYSISCIMRNGFSTFITTFSK